jgi:methyl-accepting chemotaxis protein
VGVAHGHGGLSEPLTVTSAAGATVKTVNNQPAWEVWKKHTRAAAASRGINVDTLAEKDLGAFLLTFEAGLNTPDGLKIRAPLSRGEDGSLSFACGIAEGSDIRITESTPTRQVASAVDAANRAREALGGRKVAGALVFDCICRNLILGGQFADAARGMSKALGDAPLGGFETYGEIALDARQFSGFHNTTSVVLAFPES